MYLPRLAEPRKRSFRKRKLHIGTKREAATGDASKDQTRKIFYSAGAEHQATATLLLNNPYIPRYLERAIKEATIAIGLVNPEPPPILPYLRSPPSPPFLVSQKNTSPLRSTTKPVHQALKGSNASSGSIPAGDPGKRARIRCRRGQGPRGGQ